MPCLKNSGSSQKIPQQLMLEGFLFIRKYIGDFKFLYYPVRYIYLIGTLISDNKRLYLSSRSMYLSFHSVV